MATLTGKITDVTGRAPDSISSITVKAPSVRVGGGTDLIVSSPATVDFDRDTGDVTISGLTGGLSWLHIEGDGWSDSIALSAAEGMVTLVEAIANASGVPGMADYVAMIRSSGEHAQLLARAAVDGEFGEIVRLTQAAATTAEQAATSAGHAATSAENKVDAYTPRVDALEAMAGLAPESPVDGQTANLLTQPDTLTHTAAKSFTDPIVCSLQPTPLTAVHTSTVGDIYPLEVFDGHMWGFSFGGRIFRQPAAGGEWSLYADGPVSGHIMRILPTGDGEVIVASSTQVHKSTGWATGSPTWSLKVTAPGPTNILRSGIAGTGNKFIVTTYTGASTADYPHSRYAWISLDAGDTWTIRYDAYELHGEAGNQSHIHAVEYDPWTDRFYVSEGHSHGGDIAGIYASEDDGLTWVRAEGMRQDPAPVTVTATDGGLVCGSDTSNNGLYGVQTAPITDQALDWVWEWRAGALGLQGFARHAFREPTTGLVYVAFRSNHPGVAPVIAAGSPTTGGLVYEFQRSDATIQDRIEAVVVPTPDRLHAWAASGSPTTYTHITGRLGHPAARSVHDPGNVLGGMSGDNESVTIGPQANSGNTRRSVVIGVGARLPEIDLTNSHVLIGHSATSVGTDSVTIGKDTIGSDWGVTIGHGTKTSYALTVLIGRNAIADGGAGGVGIGNDTYVRAQSVSIGYRAKSQAGAINSTAIGFNTKAHSHSVALGADTATSQTQQIAIGARAMYMQNRQNTPAPQTDGGQLYSRDGDLWWMPPSGNPQRITGVIPGA